MSIRSDKTGWFRLARIDGRWWFVTPEGNAFFSNGLNVIRPDWDAEPAFREKYEGRVDAWAKDAVSFLRDNRFNTIGADHFDPALRYVRSLVAVEPRLPYCITISALHVGYEHVPARQALWADVFAPEAAEKVRRKIARLAAEVKEDPCFLGYFTNNEVKWGVIGPQGAWLRYFLGLPPEAPGKKAFVDCIRRRYEGDLERFNATVLDPALYREAETRFEAAWGEPDYLAKPLGPEERERLAAGTSDLAPLWSWEDLGDYPDEQLVRIARVNRRWIGDLEEFMGLVAERYARLHVEAVREVDRNHLILGPRVATGYPPMYPAPVARAITRAFGIWCENHYWDAVDPDNESGRKFRAFVEGIGREYDVPVLFSECGGFGTYVPVRSQEERGRRLRTLRDTIHAFPGVVGAHYYSYIDHDKSNWGVLDTRFRPYLPLLEALREKNGSVYAERLRR